MMWKNYQWVAQSSHARNNTCITKREDLTESIGVVSAKCLSKVKLDLLRNSRMLEFRWIMRTYFLRVFGFL